MVGASGHEKAYLNGVEKYNSGTRDNSGKGPTRDACWAGPDGYGIGSIVDWGVAWTFWADCWTISDSDIALEVVDTPTQAPGTGSYSSAQTVTLSCARDQSAAIRYTTDGSVPTGGSTLYLAPFLVAVTTTIKAKAFEDAMTESALSTAVYTITVVSGVTINGKSVAVLAESLRQIRTPAGGGDWDAWENGGYEHKHKARGNITLHLFTCLEDADDVDWDDSQAKALKAYVASGAPVNLVINYGDKYSASWSNCSLESVDVWYSPNLQTRYFTLTLRQI